MIEKGYDLIVTCNDPEVDENKFELLMASMLRFINKGPNLNFEMKLQKKYYPVTIIPPGKDPKVGDIIVVPPADNHYGGKAEVLKVFKSMSGGKMVTCVSLVEFGEGLHYNWEQFLHADQEGLIKSYGKTWTKRG